MIYQYATQIIAVFFLIAVVNLLVISESYKKIITFYMHFLVIVIILQPVLRIMNSEVGSLLDFNHFVTDSEFDRRVEQTRNQLATQVQELSLGEIEERVREAADACGEVVRGWNLDGDQLVLRMPNTSATTQNCMIVQLGVTRSDVRFEGGAR
ncbi:MAG: stage III sporulation protein AF [Turicibacter sp.]|nr:stage III sporulation protein AF [Turicibacter sp.]